MHYFHQNKIWYYWLDDSPAVKAFRPVELKTFMQNAPEHITTKKEIKDYLHSKYPDAILISTKITNYDSICQYADVDPDIVSPTITPEQAEALKTETLYKK